METVKQIVNHPLSKAIALGIIGTALLLEKHPRDGVIAIGMGIREFLLAFKSE